MEGIDRQTPRCDWCQKIITAEAPGVLVNNRWRFHEKDCLNHWQRQTLAIKLHFRQLDQEKLKES